MTHKEFPTSLSGVPGLMEKYDYEIAFCDSWVKKLIDAVAELGVATTLITDGMPATLLAQGRISTFIAGADRVTMNGHWINKVGTLAIAIAAARYGVPAYGVTYAPDPGAPDPSAVVIEERDPDEVLHVRGIRTAAEHATGYYPAFDVTPPDLVTGFILDRGVFAPGGLAAYFERPAPDGTTAG